ncbi:MAG: hypothetical protein FJ152_01805 [Firmicutes bacterium]|nr:hypothetical protein [Bacillota bacterium]
MSDESRKSYKLEVWVTAICFIIVAITGGFFSSFVVILNERFFDKVPTPEQLVQHYGESMFVAKEGLTVLGFPLHYFLLIMLSWIGVTIVGAIWCIVMDRLEEKQRA